MEKESLNIVSSLVSSFIADYFSDTDNTENTEKWLSDKISSSLKDIDEEQASSIGKSIVNTVNKINENIQSIDKAIDAGGSKESWLCDSTDIVLSKKAIGTKAKILSSCAEVLHSAAEAFDNDGQFKINGELKTLEEMWEDSNWNEYKVSDLAMNIAQQAGSVAVKTLSENVLSGIEDSIQNGLELDRNQLCAGVGEAADIGIKSAAAGALQVAYKKGLLSDILPFEVKPQALTDIAVGAVENVKTMIMAAEGSLSTEEAIDRIQRNTIARVVNFLAEYGEEVGTAIGTAFGPHGIAIGKAVGKAVSLLSKTEVKTLIIEGANSLCNYARNCLNTIGEKAKKAFNEIKNAIFA